MSDDIGPDTFREAIMVEDDEGLYSCLPFHGVEDWSAVYDSVDDVELIGPLTGGDSWTHAVRVSVGAIGVTYFVR
jgi:hypothetical protein